jgi:hypothetical protein
MFLTSPYIDQAISRFDSLQPEAGRQAGSVSVTGMFHQLTEAGRHHHPGALGKPQLLVFPFFNSNALSPSSAFPDGNDHREEPRCRCSTCESAIRS